MKDNFIKKTALSGVVAAIYVVITFALAPISFGAVQCRLSEALCALPLIWPEGVWGVSLGCLLANLYSGSIIDIVFGTAATLIAAVLTYKTRKKPALAMLFPVILNGVIVGGYIGLFMNDTSMAVPLCMISVAAGEAVACYGAGLPLYYLIKKRMGKPEDKNEMQKNG